MPQVPHRWTARPEDAVALIRSIRGRFALSTVWPIFIHAELKCEVTSIASEIEAEVPEQQRGKGKLALRAFDEKHMMVDCDIVAGKDLVGKAEELFTESGVEYLRVHYAGPGCFAVRIDKAEN